MINFVRACIILKNQEKIIKNKGSEFMPDKSKNGNNEKAKKSAGDNQWTSNPKPAPTDNRGGQSTK